MRLSRVIQFLSFLSINIVLPYAASGTLALDKFRIARNDENIKQAFL